MIIIIANIIDFLAATIPVGSGWMKQKTKILIAQIVQLLLQGVSMLLLGGITGAVSNVLSCFRNYLCYKGKLSNLWKGILIAASVLLTVLLNEQGILGIIPAAVCTVYILLMDTKDAIRFKLLVTLTFLPWVVYHFALRAYVGAVVDIATIIANGVTLCQMIKEKSAKQN